MTKKRAIHLLFTAVMLAASVTHRAAAAPTIFGPTGLITMPTAESLSYKEMNISFDYLFGDDSETWYYKANLGTFKNWELGFVGGEIPDEGVFINAKYYLMSDNARYPVSVAIGVQNLTSDDLTDVYMVASKKFKGGVSGHFGFKANFNDEVDPSVMGGVEYFINNYIGLLADASGQQEDYLVNLGAHFYVIPDLSFRLTVLDLFEDTAAGMQLGLGVAYTRFL